jgi:hypothetical protein
MSDLELSLQGAARALGFPPTPELEDAVAARLGGPPARPRRTLLPVAAAAALVACAGVLGLSPGARSAALEALDQVPGVEIARTEQLPPAVALMTFLDGLGERVSLPAAERASGFGLRLPDDLPEPDVVLLDRGARGSAVTVVYGAEADAASLVLTQWHPSTLLFQKLLASRDTVVTEVHVDGTRGLWIVGDDHEVFYVGMDRGRYRGAPVLVGAALVWARDGITYRLEGDLTVEEAIALARSLEPCC